MSHAAVVDTGAQPSIPHQLFGSWKTGDVADRRQDGDGGEHGYSGKLDQQGNAFISDALLLDLFFGLCDLFLGEGERVQVGAHQELLGCRQRQAFPPSALLKRKRILLRQDQMVAM